MIRLPQMFPTTVGKESMRIPRGPSGHSHLYDSPVAPELWPRLFEILRKMFILTQHITNPYQLTSKIKETTTQKASNEATTFILSHARSVLHLLPSPADGLHKIGLSELLPAREISSGDLRVNLDAGIHGDEVGCYTVV